MIASVHSAKKRLKKIIMIIIIIIMNKSQELMVLSQAPEIDFLLELKARKSDEFDALYSQFFIKSLLKLGY